MAFDFSNIIEAETKKMEESSQSTGGYPTVYPFNTGRLAFRFLGNEASGKLYFEYYFHEFRADNKKQRTPCFQMNYGMKCPICEAVARAQEYNPNNNRIFGIYGYKRRGIMWAQLVGYEPVNYFFDPQNNKNQRQPGEIVLFMFPKSVGDEITKLILEFKDDVEDMFTSNTSKIISLSITKGANNFNDYTVFVTNKDATVCVDQAGNPDDAKFAELFKSLPDLRTIKIPEKPTEEDAKIHQTIVEEISRLYLAGAYQQPVNAESMAPPMAPVGSYNPPPPAYNQYQQGAVPIPPQPPAQGAAGVMPDLPDVSSGPMDYGQPLADVPVTPQAPVGNYPPPLSQPDPLTPPATPVQQQAPATPVTPPVTETPVTPPPAPTEIPTENAAPVGELPPGVEIDPNTNRPHCFGSNQYDDKCAKCPFDNQCV